MTRGRGKPFPYAGHLALQRGRQVGVYLWKSGPEPYQLVWPAHEAVSAC